MGLGPELGGELGRLGAPSRTSRRLGRRGRNGPAALAEHESRVAQSTQRGRGLQAPKRQDPLGQALAWRVDAVGLMGQPLEWRVYASLGSPASVYASLGSHMSADGAFPEGCSESRGSARSSTLALSRARHPRQKGIAGARTVTIVTVQEYSTVQYSSNLRGGAAGFRGLHWRACTVQ